MYIILEISSTIRAAYIELISNFYEIIALSPGKANKWECDDKMDKKKKVDENLPKNKEYILKFYKKTEAEIRQAEGEGKTRKG